MDESPGREYVHVHLWNDPRPKCLAYKGWQQFTSQWPRNFQPMFSALSLSFALVHKLVWFINALIYWNKVTVQKYIQRYRSNGILAPFKQLEVHKQKTFDASAPIWTRKDFLRYTSNFRAFDTLMKSSSRVHHGARAHNWSLRGY